MLLTEIVLPKASKALETLIKIRPKSPNSLTEYEPITLLKTSTYNNNNSSTPISSNR